MTTNKPDDNETPEEMTERYERFAAETSLDYEHEAQRAIVRAAEVNTTNEFGLGSQMGTIRPMLFPEFRTKQQAYRFVACLALMAEMLPDEGSGHTLEQITEAIRNS